MKNTIANLINKNILLNVLKVLLILIVFAMPYGIKFLPYLLSLTFFLWAISCFYPNKIKSIELKNFNVYLLPALAIISTLSLLYSNDAMTGAKVLERMISFLVLPFVIVTLKNRINFNIKHIFLLIGFSVFISVLVLIYRFEHIIGFSKLFELKSLDEAIKYFRYYLLRHSIALHPSYFSYLALIYINYTFFTIKDLSGKSLIHIFFTLISIALIVMLFSRGAIITLFLLFVYGIVKTLLKKQYLLFSLLLLITSISIFASLKYTRLGDTVKGITHNDSEKKTSAPRIIIWENALELIKEKPIFGYGIGDAIHVIIEKHKENNFVDGVEKRLDAHNQFLETWLQSGIFGLVSILLVFAVPFIQSIRKKQELLFLFLIISFLQLLFESMFVRLAGVVYFAFFYCYLYYVYYAPGGEWEINH